MKLYFKDLSIINENKKFKAKLFDKRYTSPFSVVRMPYLNRNIPSSIFYASIGSEVVRFARTTTDSNAFITLANKKNEETGQ